MLHAHFKLNEAQRQLESKIEGELFRGRAQLKKLYMEVLRYYLVS